jgi:hypothetical protein
MESLNTSTYFQDVVDSPWPQNKPQEKYKQLSLLKSTPTVTPSSSTIGPTSPSMLTSGTTTPPQGNLTLLPLGFPAPAPVKLEPKPASTIPNQPSFGKSYALLPSVIPHLSLLSNPWELSIEDLEQSLADSEWLVIKAKLKLSRRRSLERGTAGKDCLSFPTPTACLGTYRQAGSNKLEQWLRHNGLIANGSQLSAMAYALIQGYPSHWFQALAPSPVLSPPEPPAELKPENLPVEPSPQDKRRAALAVPLASPSIESCISTQCSSCNSFDSSIPANSAWKFCLLKGKYLVENDLNGCDQFKPIVPYQPPPKNRRTKGDGSGYIQLHYCHKKGKSYEQFYYHYEIWANGIRQRKGSKYIPKAKLAAVQEMETCKVSVTFILKELGLIV